MYKDIISIQDIKPETITEFFIADPSLCFLGLPDNDLQNLYHKKEYIPHNNSMYKGIYHNKNIVGILCYEQFTEYTLNVHFYISTKLHKQQLATKIKKVLKKYFKKNYPSILKIVLTVPSSCEHVINIAKHYEFILEGTLTECIKWRNELVDLLFYAKRLEDV